MKLNKNLLLAALCMAVASGHAERPGTWLPRTHEAQSVQ